MINFKSRQLYLIETDPECTEVPVTLLAASNPAPVLWCRAGMYAVISIQHVETAQEFVVKVPMLRWEHATPIDYALGRMLTGGATKQEFDSNQS